MPAYLLKLAIDIGILVPRSKEVRFAARVPIEVLEPCLRVVQIIRVPVSFLYHLVYVQVLIR